ncbi:CRISPR-associated protein Csx3 [Lusitaniella coriacea]|uniref:CRISPR-associated protein Csx3 n=1 Tax=Lusitaniella coriacea TaxID=1983105 RepID=UPI003CF31225
MTSYIITPNGDTLNVCFNPEVPAEGDRVVCDAMEQLQASIESGQLPGGKLLKIDGRQSLLVSYVMAHELGHLYSAIAVSEPRLNAYVVVTSNTPNYPFGSRIERETGRVIPYSPSLEDAPAVRLDWDGDILQPQFNGDVSVPGDRVVVETKAQLQALIARGQLKGGRKPLLINGRFSVLGSFVIAQQVAHLYGAIAVYDPKLGESGLDKYVVVISHSTYRVGDTIDVPCSPLQNIKVVLCGPPNTGKTCLREGLKQALLKTPNAPDSYVISGCPDGDGSWFSETARRNPEFARQLKDEYKANFTPEFADKKAKEVEVIKNLILVFDVGGKISSENRIIMDRATHAVILAKTDAEVKKWQAFCDELHLQVIAILYSDYHGTRDSIERESPLLIGSVHHLDRTQETSSRPTIQALARILVDLIAQKVARSRSEESP